MTIRALLSPHDMLCRYNIVYFICSPHINSNVRAKDGREGIKLQIDRAFNCSQESLEITVFKEEDSGKWQEFMSHRLVSKPQKSLEKETIIIQSTVINFAATFGHKSTRPWNPSCTKLSAASIFMLPPGPLCEESVRSRILGMAFLVCKVFYLQSQLTRLWKESL